jgi:hypothetical protein
MKYFELDTESRQIYQRKKPDEDQVKRYIKDDEDFHYLYRGCNYVEIENLFKHGKINHINDGLNVFYFCKDINYCLGWNKHIEEFYNFKNNDTSYCAYVVKYNRDVLSRQKGYIEYTEYVLQYINNLRICPEYGKDAINIIGEYSTVDELIDLLYRHLIDFSIKNNRDPITVTHDELPDDFEYYVFEFDTAVIPEITLESGLIDDIYISINPRISFELNDYDYNELYFEKLQELEQLIKNYS